MSSKGMIFCFVILLVMAQTFTKLSKKRGLTQPKEVINPTVARTESQSATEVNQLGTRIVNNQHSQYQKTANSKSNNSNVRSSTASSTTNTQNNNNSHAQDGKQYLPVHIVKELSPAGKAALEIQNSGEYLLILI
jgi:hypothetical protein